MKLKSMLKIVGASLALVAGSARADPWCDLYVEFTGWPHTATDNLTVPIGTAFSYAINIKQAIFPTPWPPGGIILRNGTIKFFGTVIGLDGEPYPGVYQVGFYTLDGFYNPGGFALTYQRSARVYWPNGDVYCETNPVTVVLQ